MENNNYILQLSQDFNKFKNQNLPPQNAAGMSVTTGKWLEVGDHINQQIQDLLLTPVSSTIMYPDYGSNILYYMDMPVAEVGIDIKIETKEAVHTYEDRIRIIKINMNLPEDKSQLFMNIEYINTSTKEVKSINV